MHQNGPSSLHHRHHRDHPSEPLRKVTNHVLRKINSAHVSQNHVIGVGPSDKLSSGSGLTTPTAAGVRWRRDSGVGMTRYSPEYALLLPSTPDEVRDEVELLLSDLVVRLKQLLFNSLLCAYYVGFIPVQFADVSNELEEFE